MKVLAFGEILWDIINGEEHLGGAPFNFAAHSAKCGNEASIISRLGDDFRGIKAFNRCKDYGVDSSLIQWDEQHPTGYVTVALNQGQPDYTIHENVAYDFIEVDSKIKQLSKHGFDLFYFGSLIQRNPISAATLSYILKSNAFRHVFYDVNLRKGGYNLSTIHQSLMTCSILKLNTDEVPVISRMVFDQAYDNESFCKAVRSVYPSIGTIVITASEKGCFVYEVGKLSHIPVKTVAVKDAVGAGDAFSAAFIHIFSQTNDAVISATTANELGAYVATQRGAIPEYSPEIISLISQRFKPHSFKAIL